ncbi:hypothetical protein H1P_6950001 [Hyella patelloides LEGE 07179]|uniref:Helicase ATP-binding domain-containing protein n=1 Tax=Hyella patelloides LEGE 07179 TaxID=945734 RepID=A0A563W325_9CYAN|nr:DEAD/DEAH box helicase family protein [Hyella patelloides]VEP18109.1 hypothetical protein H1P_6950001 [Hyella patelloides LEGE 07179]
MFFNSKEAATITGCTLRQLQYWREKGVVVPTVDATGRGRSVFYTEDDLVSLSVMEYLLSAGLDFQEAVSGLEAVKKEEPEFFNPSQTKKFSISRNLTDESLTLGEYYLPDAIASVESGQPVIPLSLKQIHRRLRRKLAEMGKIEEVEALENKKFASMSNETNTCRRYVEPKLREAGWEKEPHDYTEQYYFTAGKIQPKKKKKPRGKRKFVDYLLLYKGEFPIAVVEAKKGRDLYFAIYQAIAEDSFRPGLYKEYSPDYFDLIIIDECHRGSARSESSWRSILEYFEPAYQLGLTATPLRNDNVDTYRYFGNPLYTYSLKEGIEDGFLAPYRVYRILTRSDKDGWQPSEGQLDRYGRTIPEGKYLTPDFERRLVREARTKEIAQHLTDFLKATDRYAKTIVFCVDEHHVKAMIKELLHEVRNLKS